MHQSNEVRFSLYQLKYTRKNSGCQIYFSASDAARNRSSLSPSCGGSSCSGTAPIMTGTYCAGSESCDGTSCICSDGSPTCASNPSKQCTNGYIKVNSYYDTDYLFISITDRQESSCVPADADKVCPDAMRNWKQISYTDEYSSQSCTSDSDCTEGWCDVGYGYCVLSTYPTSCLYYCEYNYTVAGKEVYVSYDGSYPANHGDTISWTCESCGSSESCSATATEGLAVRSGDGCSRGTIETPVGISAAEDYDTDISWNCKGSNWGKDNSKTDKPWQCYTGDVCSGDSFIEVLSNCTVEPPETCSLGCSNGQCNTACSSHDDCGSAEYCTSCGVGGKWQSCTSGGICEDCTWSSGYCNAAGTKVWSSCRTGGGGTGKRHNLIATCSSGCSRGRCN